jgi:hypothetical protein
MLKRVIAAIIIIAFTVTNHTSVFAQGFAVQQLPVPGIMVSPSASHTPLMLKGLIVDPKKPLNFEFIVDTGKDSQETASVKAEANQLVRYFLAGLTVPEGDLWVNLSPYEKDRMVPEALGQTDLGRDLLAQDYILKQLTASLIYPEKDLGKEFWNRVYAKAQKQFGTTNIPVNTFNKVWILPNQAQVFENGKAVYVTKATLKVMLDEDYTAKQKNGDGPQFKTTSISSQIVRDIVLPEIEKEVNEGKNFAPLRQIFTALILAKWYKETISNGLLESAYLNKNKVSGINLDNPAIKQEIYERYLSAYKKGVFNYIKEDETSNPKKYFSGGLQPMPVGRLDRRGNLAMISNTGVFKSVQVRLGEVQKKPRGLPDAAMLKTFFAQTIALSLGDESRSGSLNDFWEIEWNGPVGHWDNFNFMALVIMGVEVGGTLFALYLGRELQRLLPKGVDLSSAVALYANANLYKIFDKKKILPYFKSKVLAYFKSHPQALPYLIDSMLKNPPAKADTYAEILGELGDPKAIGDLTKYFSKTGSPKAMQSLKLLGADPAMLGLLFKGFVIQHHINVFLGLQKGDLVKAIAFLKKQDKDVRTALLNSSIPAELLEREFGFIVQRIDNKRKVYAIRYAEDNSKQGLLIQYYKVTDPVTGQSLERSGALPSGFIASVWEFETVDRPSLAMTASLEEARSNAIDAAMLDVVTIKQYINENKGLVITGGVITLAALIALFKSLTSKPPRMVKGDSWASFMSKHTDKQLIKQLDHKDPVISAYVAEELGNRGKKKAIPYLVNVLNEFDPKEPVNQITHLKTLEALAKLSYDQEAILKGYFHLLPQGVFQYKTITLFNLLRHPDRNFRISVAGTIVAQSTYEHADIIEFLRAEEVSAQIRMDQVKEETDNLFTLLNEAIDLKQSGLSFTINYETVPESHDGKRVIRKKASIEAVPDEAMLGEIVFRLFSNRNKKIDRQEIEANRIVKDLSVDWENLYLHHYLDFVQGMRQEEILAKMGDVQAIAQMEKIAQVQKIKSEVIQKIKGKAPKARSMIKEEHIKKALILMRKDGDFKARYLYTPAEPYTSRDEYGANVHGTHPASETLIIESINQAMVRDGGVDLNQINIDRTGKKVIVDFDPAQLKQLMNGGFEGFMPVIINITPVANPLPLLGIRSSSTNQELAKKS